MRRHVFLAVSLAAMFLLWRVSQEFMFFATFLYVLGYLSLFLGIEIFLPVSLGLGISFAYLTFFKGYYTYNTMHLKMFDYPLFTLFAWPWGLTLMSYYACLIIRALKIKKTSAKVAIGYLVFIILFVTAEYLGYHLANIRLQSHYPSIPLIDCMHCPWKLKTVYFVNGFVFMLLFFVIRDKAGARFLLAAGSLAAWVLRRRQPHFENSVPTEAD